MVEDDGGWWRMVEEVGVEMAYLIVSTNKASGTLAVSRQEVATNNSSRELRWQQEQLLRMPPWHPQCQSMICSRPGPIWRGLMVESLSWASRRVTVW